MEADRRLRRHSGIGAIGQRVAENLRRERMARGWTTERLAQAATDQGVPMSATTITKIEKLDRRITIDEMAALAAALDLGPTRTALLLPRDVQAGNLIKDFVAERRLERPYHVEVNGFTSRPDNIALYIGEAALKIHREERGDG